MPASLRLVLASAAMAGWAWWFWNVVVHAAMPAYGPPAHHLAALRAAETHGVLAGAVVLALWGRELALWFRRRTSGIARGSRRSGGIRGRAAESRAHVSWR
ncbi:MAG: hypothetical protein H0Z37_02765 [Firmicutes bacterium]|nr:hypothetical protein [Bacillota bacterium]